MRWGRALAAWVGIAIAETLNGTVRQIWLVPIVGDLLARQIGVVVGSAIILAVAWVSSRWIGARALGQQLRVGLLWVALMAGFEVGLGLLLGYSGERILADYDPAAGGFMGFGMAFMLLAPALAAALRRQQAPG